MPKRVPAYASDADFGESRLDLPFEDSGKVQWLLSFGPTDVRNIEEGKREKKSWYQYVFRGAPERAQP